MNLKDIINYRSHCPICKRKLLIKSEMNKFKAKIIDGNLKISSKNLSKSALIIEEKYESDIPDDQIVIRKYCNSCYVKGKTLDTKVGGMPLASIVSKGYYYSFVIRLDKGICHYLMLREYFSLQKDKTLHIIDNSFKENKLSLEKLKTINDRWVLKSEAKDLSQYLNAESLVQMMNLFTIFS